MPIPPDPPPKPWMRVGAGGVAANDPPASLALDPICQIGFPQRRSQVAPMPNHLHYGDNLTVLKGSIASESVDLVYIGLGLRA